MIATASRATNGVKIPNRKATRQEIIDLFKRQLLNLKERMNVSTNSSYMRGLLTSNAFRAKLHLARSVLPAMHGKHPIQTHTLRSLAIGSKSHPQGLGSSEVHF
jgi:hypothetical protein